MRKKPVTLGLLVLDGACAIIWTLFAALAFDWSGDRVFSVLRAATAVVWWAAFLRWLIQYRKEQRET